MTAEQMADQLALSVGIDAPTAKAFTTVRRELFWPGPDPYDPTSGGLLKSEAGVTISTASMPFAMAQIMLAADLRDGDTVLEAGGGSGCQAAYLAARLGQGNVVTVESDPDMAQVCASNLKTAGYGDVRVVTGDGLEGLPGRTFDKLLASFSVTAIQSAWIRQCPRGRIVAPWATRWTAANGDPKVWAAAVLDVADETASGRFYPNNRFMQAHSQRFAPLPEPPDLTDARETFGPRLRAGAVTGKFHPAGAFFIGLMLPDVGYRMADGAIWVSDGTSWAQAVGDEDSMRTRVRSVGPRDLWAEIQAVYTRWCSLRHPSIDRFGLTATVSGRCELWLDHPGQPLNDLN